MKITIIVEDDGQKGTEVVYGHSEAESKTMKAMPVVLALDSFSKQQMKLVDNCFHKVNPNAAQFSSEGQDRLVKDFHERATFENLYYPGTYRSLKIIS